MGSLSQSGSFIQQLNETFRNIGGSITRTSSELPNNEGTSIKEYAAPFPSGATRADITTSQYATMLIDNVVKTTYSVDDSTISLSDRPLLVTASGNPEIALIVESTYAERHTGDKLVLGSSSGDIVISRTDNTSFRPTA